MSKYIEKAKECRRIGEPTYNCAQSVACAFAEDALVTEELVKKVSANFGGGMRMASICGAFSGGLIALGLFGLTDPSYAKEFAKMIKDNHDGTLECALLLKKNKELGREKKPHCDEMVLECTAAVEEILRKNGKID